MISEKTVALTKEIQLTYLQAGTGDTIIFIPGLTFSGNLFINNMKQLAQHYQVFALSPRGQGKSSKVAEGNDYFTHGRDLAAFIETLDLQNVILIGWSTGNLAIWSYVEQFGLEKIKKVVTIDMSPLPLPNAPEDWCEATLEEAREVATTLFNTNEGRVAFFTDYAESIMYQQPTQEKIAAVLTDSAQTPDYVCKALFADAMLSDFTKGAKKVEEEVPSLMFIAEHWSDIAVPFMKKTFPKTDVEVLGGHLMFNEYSEKWHQLLLDFLEK